MQTPSQARAFSHFCGSLAVVFCAMQWPAALASLQACQQQSKAAVDACRGKRLTAEADKNARSSAAQEAAKIQGQRNYGRSESEVAKFGQAADLGVIKFCSEQKRGCDDPCEPSKMKEQEKAPAKQAKEKCNKDIDEEIALSEQSASNLNTASDKSNDTKDNAQSQPPQPPKGGGEGEGSGEKKAKTDPTTKDTPDNKTAATPPETKAQPTATTPVVPALSLANVCSGQIGPVADVCSAQYEQTCGKGNFRSTPACEQFSARYCSTSKSSEGSSGALRAGSGISSQYCKEYSAQLAGNFCKEPGADVCPNCPNFKTGATLPSICDRNPAYADPQLAATLNKTTSPSGSAGAGAGGSSASAAEAKLQGAAPTAVGENAYGRGGLKVDASSGGGGGYSPSSSASPGESDFSPGYAKRGVASDPKKESEVRTASLATDVARGLGGNVFKILEQVILQRCLQDKMLHCGPKAR